MQEIIGEIIEYGDVEAEVMITNKPLLFNWVDINTGVVNQEDSEMNGKSVTGKILVVPCFKANIDMWRLYGLCKKGLGPVGLISPRVADDYMIVGAILSKLPFIHKVDTEKIKNLQDGQRVKIIGNRVLIP